LSRAFRETAARFLIHCVGAIVIFTRSRDAVEIVRFVVEGAADDIGALGKNIALRINRSLPK